MLNVKSLVTTVAFSNVRRATWVHRGHKMHLLVANQSLFVLRYLGDILWGLSGRRHVFSDDPYENDRNHIG